MKKALKELRSKGLVEALANEKTDPSIIIKQQKAIMDLGPKLLKKLIHRIFTEIDENKYCAKRITEDYLINETAISRFVGIRWLKNMACIGDTSKIPDLWRNMAHLLSHNIEFRTSAQKLGLISNE